jgi:hypothetical protein
MLGGIKNLLWRHIRCAPRSAVPGALADSYPIRVVANYGWSHSLQLDGDAKVRLRINRRRTTGPGLFTPLKESTTQRQPNSNASNHSAAWGQTPCLCMASRWSIDSFSGS